MSQTVEWSEDPGSDARPRCMSVRRLGVSRITGISLSSRALGARVHYWRGRSRPCGPGCEACGDGNIPRWKGYLALYDDSARTMWIQEITEAGFEGLKEGLDAFRTLRGHPIIIERVRPSVTAPMTCRVIGSVTPEDRLPDEPDLRRALLRLWDLDTTNTEAPIPHTPVDRMSAVAQGNGRKQQPHAATA